MYRTPLNGMWMGSSPVSLLRPLVGAMLLALSGVAVVQAGELEFLGTHSNGIIISSVGFGGASCVAVSPDNKYIYVAALTDTGIGFFKRDVDGQPSYLGFKLAADGLGSTYSPVKVIVTPDGAHLYAAFKPTFSNNGIVALYDRDSEGGLSFSKSYEVMDDATDLAISSDGKNLYLSGKNSVSVFDRELKLVETKSDDGVIDGLAGSSGMALTPDGKYLFVAGATDNAVAVFTRNTTTGQLGFVKALRNGVDNITGLNGARSVALSPDGINLYVAGDKALAVFERNHIGGKVTYLETWTKGVNGNNPVWELDAPTSVIVSPNGSRVYVSSGTQSAIAVFRTLPQNRKLELIGVEREGGNGVISLTSTPNGAYLYAVAPGLGKVSVFKTANNAPTPANDTVALEPGANITLHVLANDTDPDNDALQLAGADISSTRGGTVIVNSDGSITYTTPDGFLGDDSFSYMVSDVRDAKPVMAQVNVTVKPVSTETPVDTGGGQSASGGGGGSLDGWFGMLLLGAAALRRRVVGR